MGVNVPIALVAAAVGAAAVKAGAGTWVGSGVNAFLHDPTVGPTWLTGNTPPDQGTATVTGANAPTPKLLAQAQNMALNSGVKPTTTAIDFTQNP